MPLVCHKLPLVCIGSSYNIPFIRNFAPIVVIRRFSGFTFIEVMITLVIIATLLTIGVPSFNQFIEANRHSSAINAMIGDLGLARSEAIKRGQGQVVMCASSNGTACAAVSWNSGWIVFYDNNSSGTYAVADNDVLLKVYPSFPTSVTTTTTPANTALIAYNRLGTLQTAITNLQIRNTKLGITRYLCFATTGRASLEAKGATGCS